MRVFDAAKVRHGSAFRSLHRCFARSFTSSQNDITVFDVLAYADGASRGNPGRSGCGALLIDPSSGRVLASDTEYVGNKKTNNEAEYHGLMLALQLAHKHQATYVHVHMDSQLVVRQMQGLYQVKAANLRRLHQQCKKISSTFPYVIFSHVAREENTAADRLANEAIDAYSNAEVTKL